MIDRNISSEVEVRYFGQGLQRHLIYILLKISSQYVEKELMKRKNLNQSLH
jgi:putative ATP-dependent endonuclease of OLD family